MNDAEIDAAIATHLAAIEALETLKQTSAGTSWTLVQPALPRKRAIAARRWELAAAAFRDFPFEPHTVRRICANHPDWAARLTDGAWYVDADIFTEFADRVQRGEASFKVSAVSTKSVANGPQLIENKHIGKSIAKEDDSDQDRETA